MKSGRLIELRETEALFDEPQHEYTKELLSAVLEVGDAHQPSVR
jgi:ABC-type oligopeptide transport system ATPase subunit